MSQPRSGSPGAHFERLSKPSHCGVIRAMSITTFLVWTPLVLIFGYLLSQDLLPTGDLLRFGVQFRAVLLESTALISGLVAILFASLALIRNTSGAVGRAFTAVLPGAIWAGFLAWMFVTPDIPTRLRTLRPALVGWLFLIDVLLTIMLPVAWFVVWRWAWPDRPKVDIT
jgi:hypothetical protein